MPAYTGAPRCFSCQTEISHDALNTAEPVPCAGCAKPVRACVFPALYRTDAAPRTEKAQEEESTCYYHPEKRADISCDYCGRFICSLCHIDFEGQHICPGCLNTSSPKVIKSSLNNQGFNYDWLAFLLAYFGWMICWCLVGPATCYVVVRHWSARTPFSSPLWFRVRMVLAMLVGLWFVVVALGYIAFISYGLFELSRKSSRDGQTEQTEQQEPGNQSWNNPRPGAGAKG